MGKVIIGIHGLANKPKNNILKTWWEKSIIDGLTYWGKSRLESELKFRTVFWAKFLYKNQLHNDKAFSFDKLYNDEPYIKPRGGALKEYKTTLTDELRAGAFDIIGSSVDYLKEHFGMDAFADWTLDKLLKDLAFYYDDNRVIKNRNGDLELARKVLRDELANTLIEEKDNEIMLISHSMGSIIAYDVLRKLGQDGTGVKVPYFVTIGSPLGLPHVRGKIIKECNYDGTVRTPSIVTTSWVNYADSKDPVAVDIFLRDDYEENDRGIRVTDDLVMNDYQKPGRKGAHNYHKSYGYLRTPELSKHIINFLTS